MKLQHPFTSFTSSAQNVENFALIKVLLGSNQPVWTELAWWCALIKFAIVAVGLGYVLTGTAYIFMTKLLRR